LLCVETNHFVEHDHDNDVEKDSQTADHDQSNFNSGKSFFIIKGRFSKNLKLEHGNADRPKQKNNNENDHLSGGIQFSFCCLLFCEGGDFF
jgi:hypothetical protein